MQDSWRAPLVVTASLAVLTIASCTGGNSHTESTSTTTEVEVTTTATVPSTAWAWTEYPPGTVAIVKGKAGSRPPCSHRPENEPGADIYRPELAPLQEAADFGRGIRWAICGADFSGSSELLNLRSTDNGGTWHITETGIGMSPYHAGDRITIDLVSPEVASMLLKGPAGDFIEMYVTTDGGITWRQSISTDLEGTPN